MKRDNKTSTKFWEREGRGGQIIARHFFPAFLKFLRGANRNENAGALVHSISGWFHLRPLLSPLLRISIITMDTRCRYHARAGSFEHWPYGAPWHGHDLYAAPTLYLACTQP